MEKLENRTLARQVIQGEISLLVQACLEGTAGSLYGAFAPSKEGGRRSVRTAAVVLGDFCYVYGEAEEAALRFLAQEKKDSYWILIPETEAWERCIEKTFPKSAVRFTRYAMKKEGSWDRKALQDIVGSLSEKGGYDLKSIDKELFNYAKNHAWCRDWTAQFASYEEYERHGAGIAVVKGGEPVAGASAYAYCSRGIEVEIDTREDFRRRGLGLICGAGLLLNCIERGIYPSWDAHNKASKQLSEKLGYRLLRAYTAYEFFGREES